MAKLRVGVVSPEREIWSGEADMVIAKTVDGEIGIMPQHAPVLGVLVEGGVLRVKREGEGDLVAAVHGGFISVAENEVSCSPRWPSSVPRSTSRLPVTLSTGRRPRSRPTRRTRTRPSRPSGRKARLRAAGEEV